MKTYKLTRNDVEQYRGTENNCYFKLQSLQSQSADWAIKYEGWKIEPLNPKEQILEKLSELEAFKQRAKDEKDFHMVVDLQAEIDELEAELEEIDEDEDEDEDEETEY